MLKHRYLDEVAEHSEGGEGAGNSEVIEIEEDPEILAKAVKMGWSPKEEYKGDPAKWRPASEYVERGETMLPIMKKTVEKQERKIAELEQSMKEFATYHSKTEARAYERALRELKEKQYVAVQAGDTEAFVKIDKDIEDLRVTTAEKPKQSTVDHVYNEWEERNPWVKDREMLAYAEGQGLYIGQVKTGLSYAEQLEEVTKAVKKEFPNKFSNPRRESAPSVEGGGAPLKKGGKNYSDMPADARATCDRMVKNYGIKKEEYVTNYWEEA